MTKGDVVWMLYEDGWSSGTVEIVGDLVYVARAGWWRPDMLSAMQALRAASEAVAKARDAVVAAAKRYAENEPRGLHVLDAVELLWAAECAEADARAKLEALR